MTISLAPEKLANSLLETSDVILNTLGIPHEFMEIPPVAWRLIGNYFEATLPIVECKKAAMSVMKDG